jgi:hypothetical protein
MRSVASLVLCVLFTSACQRNPPTSDPTTTSESTTPAPPPTPDDPPLEVCYSGTSAYATDEATFASNPPGQDCDPATGECQPAQRVLLRRTLQPQDWIVVEVWVEGATPTVVPARTTATWTITDARFTFAVDHHIDPEGSNKPPLAWAGEGELVGEPWRWTSWTSKQERRSAVVEVGTTRLEGEVLRRDTAFMLQNGSVAVHRRDKLQAFDCAQWDARSLELLAPPGP